MDEKVEVHLLGPSNEASRGDAPLLAVNGTMGTTDLNLSMSPDLPTNFQETKEQINMLYGAIKNQ